MVKQEMTGILGKALAVVQVLGEHGEANAADISDRVGEPISSTYRLLRHLQDLDWIDAGSSRGQYRLGAFFIRIGGLVSDLMDVRDRAQPFLRELREKTHLTAYLSVRRGTRSVCIERLAGRSVHTLEYRVGDMLPLNIGAAPRALLAFLPTEERDATIWRLEQEDNERPGRAGNELLANLKDIKDRGWSLSHGDVTAGVASVGAPVFNHRGELVAAVSVAGVQEEVAGNHDIVEAALACAASISLAMGFDQGGTA